MCGIAGIIDFNSNQIDIDILIRMNMAISHRGPDDEGYGLINSTSSEAEFFCGKNSHPEIKSRYVKISEIDKRKLFNIGLSHNRFSIIDLSTNGHQPFHDKENKCCIVYNGEIYNYLELREDLIKKGVSFYTDSDTEVLLECYKYYGTDCFSKLNGFWALAIYDFEKKQVILSRDRIGKKPLYYKKIGSKFYFASEIKSLLEIPEIRNRKKINEDVVYKWLTKGLRDLNFSTFFEGVYSFPSASWSVIDASFPSKIKVFWSVPAQRRSDKEISINESIKLVRNTLEDAVKIRLRSDVPLCIELSGGMDSSALVGLASEVSKDNIITYTVRFPEKEWNEEPFANSVAKKFNVVYNVLDNPIEHFWSQIAPFTYLEEEPYHSPNLQTNQVIWSMMRQEGMKVSLNGAAGDELFAGYGGYYYPAQLENLVNFRLKDFLSNLKWTENENKLQNVYSTIEYALKQNLKRYIKINNRKSNLSFIKFNKVHCNEAEVDYRTLSKYLLSEITNTKIPYWLRSGDKGYMGIPLEVRAPFLDYRMIELGASLPSNYLVRNGWHKWILRKSLEDLLPDDVLWRKKKLGFPFPYQRFFQDNIRVIEHVIKNSSNPYIDFSKVDLIKSNWYVLSFILWYEFFINENYEIFEKIIQIDGNTNVNQAYQPLFLKTFEKVSFATKK